MGKVYQKVNIGEFRRGVDNDPEYNKQVEVLKSILSRTPPNEMPCIAAERDEEETKEGVPAVFMDSRIIFANINGYGRVMMINPEECGVRKVKYFDPYQKDNYTVSIGTIENNLAFWQCMRRLDGKADNPKDIAKGAAVTAGKKTWGFARDQVWPRAKKLAKGTAENFDKDINNIFGGPSPR